MKKWTYATGFIFLALLCVFTYFKIGHRAMPDWLFYIFCISAAVFFFCFIFAALGRSRDKEA
jgi:uncharacterized membrane protein